MTRALALLLFAGAVSACDAFDVDAKIDAAPPPASEDKLLSEEAGAGDVFGSAVAISGDTLAVGAPGFDLPGAGDGEDDQLIDDAGAVFVYSRSGGAPVRVVAPDPRPRDRFGAAVSLDGDLLTVGAPGADDAGDNTGAVYLFERAGTDWMSIPVVP